MQNQSSAKDPAAPRHPEIEDIIHRASNIARCAGVISERDIRALAASFAADLEEVLLKIRAEARPPAKVFNLSAWLASHPRPALMKGGE